MDSRGVFVTLSNYCPTVTEMLFTYRGPVAIVAGPDPNPGGMIEGLDAGDVLPPLLTTDVLMDFPGLSAWEAHVVSWLGGSRNPEGRWSPEQTLASLESHARALSAWRPGIRALSEAVEALPSVRPPTVQSPSWDDERKLRQLAQVALVPPYTWLADPPHLEHQWERLRAGWHANAAIINRFLAAHAFASWLPYQGGDVVTGIRGLRLALAVLRAESARACDGGGAALTETSLQKAIRQTDLLLAHLVDRQRVAALLVASDR